MYMWDISTRCGGARETFVFFFSLSKSLYIIFFGKCFQMSTRIDVDKQNSFKMPHSWEISGYMLSVGRKI